MDIYFSSYPVLRLRALGWGFPGLRGGLSRFGVLGLFSWTAPSSGEYPFKSIGRIQGFIGQRLDTETVDADFNGVFSEASCFNEFGNCYAIFCHNYIFGIYLKKIKM
jgi:hypothetical protein